MQIQAFLLDLNPYHLFAINPFVFSAILLGAILLSVVITYFVVKKIFKLKRQKSRYDIRHNYISLIDNFNGMAYRCLNDEFWTMKYVSKKTYELIGYREEEVLENKVISFEEIIHPRFRNILRDKWQKVLAAHEDFTEEYIIVAKNKEEKWVHENGHGVFDSLGNLLYIEGFIHDVSKNRLSALSERISYDKYRNLIENSLDAIYIIERDIITYANPSCIQFFRATSIDDLVGKRAIDLIGEKYVSLHHDRIHLLEHSHLPNKSAEYEFKRFDNTVAYADVSSSPYYENNEMLIFVFIHDNTEKVQQEMDIRKIQKRNRDLIIEMKEGIGVFEINPDKDDAKLVFQNNRFTFNLLGQLTKLTDLTFSNLFPFIERQDFNSIFQVVNSSEPFSNEYFYQNRYLEVRFFTNVDKELVTMVNDITEKTKAFQKIKDQTSKLEMIIYGTNAGTWEYDVFSGVIIVNERWCEMIGYTHEEMNPSSLHAWEQLVHPDDVENAMEALNSHFEHRSDDYMAEFRLRHKDGHYVWILDRGKVSERDEAGNPLKMFGTHQDITRRKEKELELEFVSYHDYLTKLHNRRAFENYVLKLNNEKDFPIGIIMGDVNDLKIINDQYGHETGDNVLIAVSELLVKFFEQSFVSRTGGDEFVIITHKATEKDLDRIIDEFLVDLDSKFDLKQKVSVSFGYEIIPDSDHSIVDALRNAEKKMYAHKNGKK